MKIEIIQTKIKEMEDSLNTIDVNHQIVLKNSQI